MDDSDENILQHIRDVYEVFHHPEHKLRYSLYYMCNIPEIRKLKGKDK